VSVDGWYEQRKHFQKNKRPKERRKKQGRIRLDLAGGGYELEEESVWRWNSWGQKRIRTGRRETGKARGRRLQGESVDQRIREKEKGDWSRWPFAWEGLPNTYGHLSVQGVMK